MSAASITLVGLLLGGGSLFAASLSTGLLGLSAALFGFGAGFGTINVAVNAQGVALESLSGRRILSSFHALFSAGGLVGAGTAAVVAAGRQPRARVMDLLIASTAHAHEARLYTRNPSDLIGLEDLLDIAVA